MYRPPKLQAADDSALYDEINVITQNKDAIIIGDFNCPNVDWNLMHGDQESNTLVEMVEDQFLTRIVKEPAREHNILDLVLVTDPHLIHNCEVGEKLNGWGWLVGGVLGTLNPRGLWLGPPLLNCLSYPPGSSRGARGRRSSAGLSLLPALASVLLFYALA